MDAAEQVLTMFPDELGSTALAASTADAPTNLDAAIEIAAGKEVQFGDSGVVLDIPGAEPGMDVASISGGTIATDESTSTDTLTLQTSPEFVESFNILHDQSAPETFSATVATTEDQELVQGPENTAAVLDESGNPVVIVSAPFAVDSGGTPVPLELHVARDQIIIEVDHIGGTNVDYPVLVDPSYYFMDGMNDAEGGFCKWPTHWNLCNAAKGHADKALAEAENLYPSTLHNGRGDAFRHCYWSARMRSDIGLDEATGFGDRHENYSGNPILEKTMDLSNNKIGRDLAYKGGTTYTQNRAACRAKADKGSLWTIKNGQLV